MSFDRAAIRRFNDTPGGGVPPNAYTPKFENMYSSTGNLAIGKSARFNANKVSPTNTFTIPKSPFHKNCSCRRAQSYASLGPTNRSRSSSVSKLRRFPLVYASSEPDPDRSASRASSIASDSNSVNMENNDELSALYANVQAKLYEKEQECETMTGQLEEARAAREFTLQEFNALSDKYDNLQASFELQITELSKEKEAIKQSLEEAQTVNADATAVAFENTEKLRAEVNRLQEEKMKFLVDIEQKERDAQDREMILIGKSAKLADTQKEFDKAKEDIDKMQSELMVLCEFRSSSIENQQLVADKSKIIEDLEKQVGSLNASKDKLKETLIGLDEELKQFQMTLIDKNEEIGQLQAKMLQLESENVTLREVIKDCQTEINATKDLKVTVEDKMKKVEAAFEKIKTEKDNCVNDFQSQIEQLVTTNQTLEDQFKEITSRNQELEANNEHLQKCVDALRNECSDYLDENTVVVSQLNEQKNVNVECQAMIRQLEESKEELLTKNNFMTERLTELELEKDELREKMVLMFTSFRQEKFQQMESMKETLNQLTQAKVEREAKTKIEFEKLIAALKSEEEKFDAVEKVNCSLEEEIHRMHFGKLELEQLREEKLFLVKKIENLESLIEPFKQKLVNYQEMARLEKEGKEAAGRNLEKILGDYAGLVGHNNSKQKIYHLMKLKEELSTSKKEADKYRMAYHQERQKNIMLERDTYPRLRTVIISDQAASAHANSNFVTKAPALSICNCPKQHN